MKAISALSWNTKKKAGRINMLFGIALTWRVCASPTWAEITAFTRRPLDNLKSVSTSRRPRRNPRLIANPTLELWEIRAAERSGINPATLKEELSELWRSTDSGKAFAAALDERGYMLAKGDRRDFCVIDQAGDAHTLARRLDGVKAKDVRERMADVPRDSLPTVAEAREAQRTRPPLAHQPELEQTTVAPAAPAPKPQEKPSPEIAPAPEIARDAAQPTDQPPAASLGKTAGEIRILWNVNASAESFAAALDERGMSLARVDGDEAAASQRAHDFAKALGNYSPRYDEGKLVVVNSFGNVHKLNERTTGQTHDQSKSVSARSTPPRC